MRVRIIAPIGRVRSRIGTGIPRETVVKKTNAPRLAGLSARLAEHRDCLKLGQDVYLKNPCHTEIVHDSRHPRAYVVLEAKRADEPNSSKSTARSGPSLIQSMYPR